MKFEMKIGSLRGHAKDGQTTIRMASLEVEGDAAFVNAALKGLGEGLTGVLPEGTKIDMLPAARVQRCGNCGVLGHKRPTCELSGGGRGPA